MEENVHINRWIKIYPAEDGLHIRGAESRDKETSGSYYTSYMSHDCTAFLKVLVTITHQNFFFLHTRHIWLADIRIFV